MYISFSFVFVCQGLHHEIVQGELDLCLSPRVLLKMEFKLFANSVFQVFANFVLYTFTYKPLYRGDAKRFSVPLPILYGHLVTFWEVCHLVNFYHPFKIYIMHVCGPSIKWTLPHNNNFQHILNITSFNSFCISIPGDYCKIKWS